jgi:[ribosomal protein S5]-alanine N-acetyltransferase
MFLSTQRLILREFTEEDWRAVLAYQSDPRYLRFYPWAERKPEDVQAFVQRFLSWRLDWPRSKFQMAVTLAETQELIGMVGIRKESPAAIESDVGYEIAPAHWRNGYATEAAAAMLGFAFAELKVHRVWAHCVADNVASARVLAKLGMQQEGRLRENQWMKGRWWDSLVFAILEQEWRK